MSPEEISSISSHAHAVPTPVLSTSEAVKETIFRREHNQDAERKQHLMMKMIPGRNSRVCMSCRSKRDWVKYEYRNH